MKQVIHYLLFLHTSHTRQLLTRHPDFLHPSFFPHNHFLPCGEVVGFDKIPLRHSDQREHYTIQRPFFLFLLRLCSIAHHFNGCKFCEHCANTEQMALGPYLNNQMPCFVCKELTRHSHILLYSALNPS